MPHNPGRQPYGSYFAPLVAYLATREEETVTLTLAQIEAIIGRPLAVSAQVDLSYWRNAQERRIRDLHALGWEARLDVAQRVVVFRRTPRPDPDG